MSDQLELAIKEWVDRFETRPVNSSKAIRLSSVSVTIHRMTDFGSEWLWYITCDSPSHPEQGRWAWTGVATNTDPDGWTAHGISGGGGHPLNRGIAWANLGGQYSEDGLDSGDGSRKQANRSTLSV